MEFLHFLNSDPIFSMVANGVALIAGLQFFVFLLKVLAKWQDSRPVPPSEIVRDYPYTPALPPVAPDRGYTPE